MSLREVAQDGREVRTTLVVFCTWRPGRLRVRALSGPPFIGHAIGPPSGSPASTAQPLRPRDRLQLLELLELLVVGRGSADQLRNVWQQREGGSCPAQRQRQRRHTQQLPRLHLGAAYRFPAACPNSKRIARRRPGRPAQTHTWCMYCVSSFISTMAAVSGMNTQSRTAASSTRACAMVPAAAAAPPKRERGPPCRHHTQLRR